MGPFFLFIILTIVFFLEKPNAVMIGRISKNETSAWHNVDPIYREVFRNQIERYFECCIYCSTFFSLGFKYV